MTIPCVTGPYAGVNCILSLSDPISGSLQSIATSSGQNDSGVFQFNFNDERYLPFEGANIENNLIFSVEMNDEYRAFDYGTITDVLLHINYTADPVSETTETKISSVLFTKLISMKNEFSNEWYEAKQAGHLSQLKVPDKFLPYFSKNRVTEITFRHAIKKDANYESLPPLPDNNTGEEEEGVTLPSVSISEDHFQLNFSLINLIDVDDVLLAVNYNMA